MTGEIRQGLLPLVAVVGIIAVAGIILSFVAAHWIVRPITRLTKVADRITRGDLETADEYPKSHDEIGELARSLGRMRASLKAAMSRLDHQST
jgi:protein-histidine pros-kinase